VALQQATIEGLVAGMRQRPTNAGAQAMIDATAARLDGELAQASTRPTSLLWA